VVTATAKKFGHPQTLIATYEHWSVLLRMQQVTLGSLVLVANGEEPNFSDLSPAAFTELGSVIGDIEAALRKTFAYEKINYLMLMMVDPHVHFHVLPRYSSERSACGLTVVDAGWPKTPALGEFTEPSQDQAQALIELIKSNWR
jgi:diadenosine tetraphosphate (Ap4A) HIT family hydrolase